MSAQPSVELRTARLLLRPFRAGDAPDVFAYASDPEVAFFANDAPPLTIEGARKFVERALATPWSERQRFAITVDNAVIGAVDLQPDWPNASANVGYEVARTHWGQGIATEATEAVVRYGFEVLGLAKIHARADPRNAASMRVLEKIGMSREGLLRSHLVRRGERVDQSVVRHPAQRVGGPHKVGHRRLRRALSALRGAPIVAGAPHTPAAARGRRCRWRPKRRPRCARCSPTCGRGTATCSPRSTASSTSSATSPATPSR
ncbi:MAG: N-acetyltransferase [Dehalococcoidia bacterium]|nr:N-acetyltransferase [Dehalococcoidia bacterium]